MMYILLCFKDDFEGMNRNSSSVVCALVVKRRSTRTTSLLYLSNGCMSTLYQI